ncbi:GHMP kinase [Anaerosporomusa subterranea]|uniref:GHMP kinase n=1 Tax=Anaerosporomusa subterranea TaxID=1794912 RepID=A0A154BS08_ANASB|nr:GHMP kinase [Anaerosporomusa subterranea]KYZ76721.1 GHMP kinase [Anaerosporomusa subterranea]
MGITVKAPGTCGELVQGAINGQNFLITCPINVYSTVEIGFGQQQTSSIGDKTRTAVKKTLAYLQQSAAELTIAAKSELPIGKGMASSSADIAAACQATAQYFGRVLTADEIADIALAIEPTDGIFYPGIVMFDHVSGSIRRLLGAPPTIYIAVFDVGGEVNTQRFNQRDDLAALNAAKESLVQQAVELVTEGLRYGDSQMIGRGATLSAVANQTTLYKPCLEKVIEIAERYGAVGVNAAHSGTVLGILFPASERSQMSSCIKTVSAACSGITYWRIVEMISGGLTTVEG